MQNHLKYKLFYFLLIITLRSAAFSQAKDSSTVLKIVTVTAAKKKNTFTSIIPEQSLSRDQLQQLNTISIGDAAKYFSGVLIKDYGGVGGLKTISVRGLGASQTGILYDGIPVADEQSGQIDLSKYSSTFSERLDLHLANPQDMLVPARAYSSAAILNITTQSFNVLNIKQRSWQAGIRSGSFGLWQPFAGFNISFKNSLLLSANAETLWAKGDYPYYVDNGNFSKKTRRDNSEVRSLQSEINLLKLFADSSILQLKAGAYNAKRGLPGAIIFFNDRSVQKLWNNDYLIQGRYKRSISNNTLLLLSVKFGNTHTRYVDIDYLNNQGGLDNRYTQNEFYFSAAVSSAITNRLALSAASDVSFSKMTANLKSFAYPSRKSFWNNIAVSYNRNLWQATGSLLLTNIYDNTKAGITAGNKSKLTPAVALSVKPSEHSAILFRSFYKQIFRMPTFDDLYYNFIGNTLLRPEYSNQFDFGIAYSKRFTAAIRQFNISVDAYNNVVKDKIIAVPNKSLFVWTMLNLGKVDIKGIDITSELQVIIFRKIKWFTHAAYTWQHALDITDPKSVNYKNRIPYTPDHSGSGLTGFEYCNWSVGYSMIFSGVRYTLGQNSFYSQVAGWMTQDVFVSRAIQLKTFKINLKVQVDNITDQNYDVVRYYPMPGRSFKFSAILNNL